MEQGTYPGPCKPVAMVISAPLLAPVPDTEGLVNGCSCSTTSVQWPSVLVLTGGAKYQFDERGLDHRRIHSKEGWECSIPPAVRHFKLHLHDLRSLSDPNNGAYSACTGRRQEILNQILDRQAGRALMSMIFRDIERAVSDHRPVIVMPYCTSNRHRSVAMGTLVSAGLYVHGVNHFLGHMHANESWPRMKCGGHCAFCRGWFDDNRAIELGTRVLAQLDPKITGYAKHPADEERARASRVPPPDPAIHARTSASLGPLASTGGTPRNPPSGSLASSRRSITPNKQPKGGTTGERTTPTAVPSSASGVYRHRLPRIRRRTGRRVDPLVGHRDALDLATRVAAAVVDLLRGHHTYLGGQLIWSGETVLSVRKHCWTDCKLRTRSCGSESTHSKPRRTSSRKGIVSFMVKPGIYPPREIPLYSTRWL